MPSTAIQKLLRSAELLEGGKGGAGISGKAARSGGEPGGTCVRFGVKRCPPAAGLLFVGLHPRGVRGGSPFFAIGRTGPPPSPTLVVDPKEASSAGCPPPKPSI